MNQRCLRTLLLLVFILTFTLGTLYASEASLEVHFIDVGQGDSALISFPSGQVMLIDGGTGNAAGKVVGYLRDQGISEIHHLIATHPHEDHIGGLIYVMMQFPVKNVYMPRAANNTRAYERLLLTIKENDLKITQVKAGLTLDVGSGVDAVFVAPVSDSYSNLNNFSAVLHLTYDQSNFLFTGDAEKLAEREILASSKTHLFSVALGAWVDSIVAIFNRVAIPKLFKVNDFRVDKLPKLATSDIEVPDLGELGEYISRLAGSGMELFPDDELENHLRTMASLPKKDLHDYY